MKGVDYIGLDEKKSQLCFVSGERQSWLFSSSGAL